MGAPLSAQQALSESAARQQQRAAGLRIETEVPDPVDSQQNSSLVFGSDSTYRWEGAAIGFAVGAALFTYAGLNLCEDNCGVRVPVGALVGGAFFGFPGLLIGGLFSKHSPARTKEGEAAGTP